MILNKNINILVEVKMKEKLNIQKIKLFVIDVDGTMTDGGIYYDENGNELKKFCTKDAVGFFAIHIFGAKTMILTGRESKATERRMNELKIDFLFQNIKNKAEFIKKFAKDNQIDLNQIVYIGDDLNDLKAMKIVGYVGCPLDSCNEVKKVSSYISEKKGGHGAVRDIVEYIFKDLGIWENIIENIYGGI